MNVERVDTLSSFHPCISVVMCLVAFGRFIAFVSDFPSALNFRG